MENQLISIKKIRKNCGYTQTELANKLGIKQQQYARYEKGTNKISLEMFLKILNVCQLKMEIKSMNVNE